MTLTGHRLQPLNMAARSEEMRRERLYTAHSDPAVREAAREMIEAGTVPDDTASSTYARATASGATPYARRRDAEALSGASEGWTASTVHLTRAYDHAVGWALTYSIDVYTVTERGVYMRGLHELNQDIARVEAPMIEAKRMVAAKVEDDEQFRALCGRMSKQASAGPRHRRG